MPRPRRVRLKSYAKVNLGLEVLAVRTDGFHELRTLFQSVNLADDLEVEVGPPGGVKVACAHPLVPRDGTNLARRAAEELLRYAGRTEGVRIAIEKRIPVGGGLGGGSGNAAAVLLALDRLLGLRLGLAGLLPLARRLGADVPFFLYGGTALGLGRGDEIYPLRRQIDAHVVLVFPGEAVSTAAVFRRVDSRLTPRENGTTIFRFVSSDLEGLPAYGILTNELEEAALEEAPVLRDQVKAIRGLLVREGAELAVLSGSGSTYFGLFTSGPRARRARTALASHGYHAIAARTLTLERYRRSLSRALAPSGREPRGRGR
jgi:4-diphosphocytidyl-2-C-methyl-D-erythritol kinase